MDPPPALPAKASAASDAPSCLFSSLPTERSKYRPSTAARRNRSPITFFQYGRSEAVLGWGPHLTRPFGKSLMRNFGLRKYDKIRVHATLHYERTTTHTTSDSIGNFGFQLKAKFQRKWEGHDDKNVSEVLQKSWFQNVTFAHFLEALELRDWNQKLDEVKFEFRDDNGHVVPRALAEDREYDYDDGSVDTEERTDEILGWGDYT